MRRDELRESSGRPSRIRAFNVRSCIFGGSIISRICSTWLSNMRSLALVVAAAVVFAEYRASWGLAWAWNVPVFAAAIVLVGAIQHRLAGLGHEASHYSFMKNKLLNDLVPDLFCMFPLMTTVHFYRLFHMAHHQFTNDPRRDPDLQNLGHGKRADEFPMTRGRFVRVIYFALRGRTDPVPAVPVGLFPGEYPGARGRTSTSTASDRSSEAASIAAAPGYGPGDRLRAPAQRADLGPDATVKQPGWLLPAGVLGFAHGGRRHGVLPGVGPVPLAVPPGVFAPDRQRHPPGILHDLARGPLAPPVGHRGRVGRCISSLLWLVPLTSSFMFFMFLRDVYQHSNADDGRLTNSRVFFTDPFTRWAVFVYGQDMHIPHHLFPAIPHYRLRDLHDLLKQDHSAYRQLVVETHGTFRDPEGRPTILDEMTRPSGRMRVADRLASTG